MTHSEILKEARKLIEEDANVPLAFHSATIGSSIVVLSYLIEQYESTGR